MTPINSNCLKATWCKSVELLRGNSKTRIVEYLIMILSFHPCFDAHVQIILGDRPLDSRDLELINKAEAIILPQGCHAALYEACSRSGALTFPSYKMRFKYPGKIGQSHLLGDLNFPYPKTLAWLTVKEFMDTCTSSEALPHEFPFLIKEDTSHEAYGVYFIKDKTSLSSIVDRLIEKETSGMLGFVTQDFVPSGGNVLRAVIIGKKIITYWKRPHKPGQVITSVSRGAVIDHNWQPHLKERGETQAQNLSGTTGINLAAIDFVFPHSEKDPNPLFLEINYYFARRGLGGAENYYHLLHQAIQVWLAETGLNPKTVRLV